jgi:hypothetical protein
MSVQYDLMSLGQPSLPTCCSPGGLVVLSPHTDRQFGHLDHEVMRGVPCDHHFVTATPLSSCLLVGSDISREAACPSPARQGLSHGSASRVGDHLKQVERGYAGGEAGPNPRSR